MSPVSPREALEPAAEVAVQCADDVVWPPGTAPAVWVAAALTAGSAARSAAGSVTVRLVGSEEMATLNGGYRGQHKATNVLAFPGPVDLSLPAGIEPELGDVIVCLPVAEAEAGAQGKTLVEHLAHLVVHGSLHLLGYDHHEDRDAEVMEGLERHVLGQLGFTDPYQQVPG